MNICGHHATIKSFECFDRASEKYTVLVGAWICEETKRKFAIGVISNAPETTTLFEDFADSFACH
jgi:hypothetical protein